MGRYRVESKTLTQKELENGIWQFLLDHAKCFDDNLWKVSLMMKSKDEVMSRIFARASLMYKIKDEDKIQAEQRKQMIVISNLCKKQ